MKYFLILPALLVFAAGLPASAAPKQAAPGKAAPKKTPAAVRPVPGGFPDVPADHWAAQAVETLRKAGIVRGYPAHGK